MKNYNLKTTLVFLLILIGFSNVFGQKCKPILENDYDADTDIEYSKVFGNAILNDGAKGLLTGFQDVIALFAAKTMDDELFIYLQHTRYINSDNTTSRENLSIKKGNELILRGDFGKFNLVAEKDQSASSKVKTSNGQTHNKITSIYKISPEDLEKLCSGLISTVIINYDTAPKLIKEVKEKMAKKHLQSWECAPKELL